MLSANIFSEYRCYLFIFWVSIGAICTDLRWVWGYLFISSESISAICSYFGSVSVLSVYILGEYRCYMYLFIPRVSIGAIYPYNEWVSVLSVHILSEYRCYLFIPRVSTSGICSYRGWVSILHVPVDNSPFGEYWCHRSISWESIIPRVSIGEFSL